MCLLGVFASQNIAHILSLEVENTNIFGKINIFYKHDKQEHITSYYHDHRNIYIQYSS